MRYLVVVEEGPTSFGAHVPDLPGCVAVAETRNEVLALIKEAMEFHIQALATMWTACGRRTAKIANYEYAPG
jgi:predicted RNase H-like HicB family nuclease